MTKPETIKKFLSENKIDAVINCAAIARMVVCEKDPAAAIETNIKGTANLVSEIIEQKKENEIRFIHISTDGVYGGSKGDYSETDAAIPVNKYGWSKLGAECSVNLLPNFCIIRARFFDPTENRFNKYPRDLFTSKITISEMVKAISVLLESNFIGTVNVGGERKSEYQRHKEINLDISSCMFEELIKDLKFNIPKDSSLNCNLWKKIK